MIYSDKVMDHFQNPRNVGAIEDPDGLGKVGNPVCGDMMEFTIKVRENRLEDIKFKTFGCGAAIAVSSIVSEMAMGKTLDEAMKITNKKVAEELGGLPKNKLHCSNLGADALHAAIEDYRNKQKLADKVKKEGKDCACPYCDELFEKEKKFCQSCQVELVDCPECGEPIRKGSDKCLHCGATKIRV
jgi:nitrogen fixation NifU-like protein